MNYITRNPRAGKALVGSGTFMGLLVLSLFWKVGEFDEVKIKTDPATRGRFQANLIGLSFMLVVDISMFSAMNVLLQIPLQAPVFTREVANKMYSIPAYYLGRLFSQICVQVFYPFIIILIVYFGIHGNNEFGNVALLLLYGVFINVTMVCQAFFFGTLSDNFMAVEQFHIMPMLLFMLTAGTFVNSASMPTVISYFSYINPLRYAV